MTRKFVLAIAVLALASHASASTAKDVRDAAKKPDETTKKAMDMSVFTNKKTEEIGKSTSDDRRDAVNTGGAKTSELRGFEARFAKLAKPGTKELELLQALDIAAADPAVRESQAMKNVVEALKAADGNLITVTKAVEDGMAKAGKKATIDEIINNCKGGKA